jgi:hypothetical protein
MEQLSLVGANVIRRLSHTYISIITLQACLTSSDASFRTSLPNILKSQSPDPSIVKTPPNASHRSKSLQSTQKHATSPLKKRKSGSKGPLSYFVLSPVLKPNYSRHFLADSQAMITQTSSRKSRFALFPSCQDVHPPSPHATKDQYPSFVPQQRPAKAASSKGE